MGRSLNRFNKLLGVVVALLCAPIAYGQGAYIPARSVNSNVNGVLRPVAGATITVCAASNANVPCAPPLAGVLFKDQALTQPLANPTTTDLNGNYPTMALAAGNYTITETAVGFTGFSYQITVTCGTGACTASSLTVTGLSTLSGGIVPPLTISGTGTVNVPTFNVAQTGAINTAGTVNGITEGCALPANAVWNIMFNLNQCDAAGASIPSLPLYVQANPSGSQSGNTAGANWSVFDQMKCQNFTGNPAFLNCQGLESEAFYSGTLAVPNNLQQKALGGQVWIDNSTTATTAQVPFGISVWAGAPFLAYAGCGSCGTGNFTYAVSLRAEQPTALDSKGNPVGTANRAAAQFTTNFTNDPLILNFDKTGTTTWQLFGTANTSVQPFDFALQNVTTSAGFRFQTGTNGNTYIRASGTGQVIFNGNPTFAGEGPTTNSTSGAAFLPGGASGSVCTPSTAGVINLCSNTNIDARNNGNTLDVRMIGTDAFTDVFVGDANVSAVALQSSSGGGGILIFNAPGIGCNTGGSCSAGTAANPFSKPFFSNCTSSASPAVCGANSTGSVAIAAAATTLTVNTTAVTANSVILLTRDDSLGTKLSVTCNTATVMGEMKVSARTAGTSFTITVQTAPVTNPGCVGYTITN